MFIVNTAISCISVAVSASHDRLLAYFHFTQRVLYSKEQQIAILMQSAIVETMQGLPCLHLQQCCDGQPFNRILANSQRLRVFECWTAISTAVLCRPLHTNMLKHCVKSNEHVRHIESPCDET